MRILVTGGTGFIGRHLVRALQARDDVTEIFTTCNRLYKASPFSPHKVQLLWGNLSEFSKVRLVMEKAQPSLVFHLAANPIVKTDQDNPTKIAFDNVLMTHNLLECAPHCRFVFASSATVYGDRHHNLPAYEDDELRPESVYAATKVSSEALVRAYDHQGRVDGISLRLVANVGAGATHGVVKDLVRKLKSDSPTLDLIGDEPGSIKPYCHVSDTVSAFVQAGFESKWDGIDAVNVSTSYSISIELLAHILMGELGIQKPLNWCGNNWVGDSQRVAVATVQADILGWKPQYSTSVEAVIQAVKDILCESSSVSYS